MKFFVHSNINLLLIGLLTVFLAGGGSANADLIFGTPTNLGSTVNSSVDEFDPDISADGLSLYFTSNRIGGSGDHDLWVTTRPNTSLPWGPPVNLGVTVNGSVYDGASCISADGLSLYFTSNRTGGSGNNDLWVTTRPTTSMPWGPPVNLGATVNSSYSDHSPSISADELWLYFHSDRTGGSGNNDIWLTWRETKAHSWITPVNINVGIPINTSAADGGPSLSADILKLFFDSTRSGGQGYGDIWVTTRDSISHWWGTPVNLGSPVNSSSWDLNPDISSDGSTLYLATNRSGGFGGFDIWQVPIFPVVDLNKDGIVNLKDFAIFLVEPAAREVSFGNANTIDGAFNGAGSVYAADVDGDNDLDVLGAAWDADDITWWENTAGDGTVWTEHTIDGAFDAATSVYAADIDGDGDLDVLGAATVANDITWWENTAGDGTAWTEHTIDGAFVEARSVYAADVDGDGDMDVLGAASYADDITWWENTAGDGTAWTEHTIDGAFVGAFSVYGADVDGDGDLDVLGAAISTDDITWWENTAGDGTAWTEHTVDGDFDYAISVYAADLDGDGDLDVLGAAFYADDITWWENTAGDGTAWTKRTVDGDFDAARSVYAADMDGDGDLDVLGAAFDAGDITWWENTAGDGTAWTERTIDGDFDGTGSVYASDVDGDGDLDVLGAAYLAGDITWWENVPVILVDFNKDGIVDSKDLAIFLENWLWEGSWQ